MSAYYNECDPYAAQWLRNLIAAGHIAPGEVDERSIVDVRSTDLVGCTQCHFFAGIGVWSHALRLAGWPDDRPVWTGSCPCQPFSAAGKGEGTGDARHLWPVWFRLIGECRPVVVFGEQVAAAIRHGWLDLVCADLEGLDYTVGAAVMGAHSVGAPHIRQRLYFVADDNEAGRRFERRSGLSADSDASRRHDADGRGESGLVADADRERLQGQRPDDNAQGRSHPERQAGLSDRAVRSFWSDADWLPCIDGKARPVEPSTFPLAHGATARVGRLRAYGNAIVPQAAAALIRAFLETRP